MKGAGGLLGAATAATIRRLQHLDAAEGDQLDRVAAWKQMSDDGMSYRAIERAMRAALAERGVSEADIDRAGVSHYNIGLTVRSCTP